MTHLMGLTLELACCRGSLSIPWRQTGALSMFLACIYISYYLIAYSPIYAAHLGVDLWIDICNSTILSSIKNSKHCQSQCFKFKATKGKGNDSIGVERLEVTRQLQACLGLMTFVYDLIWKTTNEYQESKSHLLTFLS